MFSSGQTRIYLFFFMLTLGCGHKIPMMCISFTDFKVQYIKEVLYVTDRINLPQQRAPGFACKTAGPLTMVAFCINGTVLCSYKQQDVTWERWNNTNNRLLRPSVAPKVPGSLCSS